MFNTFMNLAFIHLPSIQKPQLPADDIIRFFSNILLPDQGDKIS
jgi:hypothetical protein